MESLPIASLPIITCLRGCAVNEDYTSNLTGVPAATEAKAK